MKRSPVLVSLLAVVVSSLVPYAVSAHGDGPPGGIPMAKPVVVEVQGDGGGRDAAPERAARAQPSGVPGTQSSDAPEAGTPHNHRSDGDELLPSPDTPGEAGNLVREVHVLHARTQVPAGLEPPPSARPECPDAPTCPVNQVRSARFPTDEDGAIDVVWHFNDDGRRNLRAPAGLLESAMEWATSEWSRWNPKVSFTYGGTTDAAFGARGEDGTCSDATNVVTWERFPASVIAAVVTCFDRDTGEIRDADLALNVTQHWEDITGEPNKRHTFDIRSIVTHEIGHWLSLEDVYTSDASRQTMFGHASYGETHKRTLALGDIIGLQTVYPCGDSCPREGIVDD